MAGYKLFNSKNAAINYGCKEDQLTEKDGVVYCNCAQIDLEDSIKEVKEEKISDIKVTKEYKVKKTTK